MKKYLYIYKSRKIYRITFVLNATAHAPYNKLKSISQIFLYIILYNLTNLPLSPIRLSNKKHSKYSHYFDFLFRISFIYL